MTDHPDFLRGNPSAGVQFTEDQTQHIKQNYVKVEDLKGLWLPEQYLWAEDLKPNEKILMSFIRMADQKDHCWASNSTLGKWMQLPVQTVKNLIVGLKKKGYLEQISWDGRHKRVIRCLK
jgi:hypothetical protein